MAGKDLQAVFMELMQMHPQTESSECSAMRQNRTTSCCRSVILCREDLIKQKLGPSLHPEKEYESISTYG